MWPKFELDLELIKINNLSKIHDDCFINVTARVLTMFSFGLDWWPRASVKRTYDVYYALRLPPDVQIELQRRTADFRNFFCPSKIDTRDVQKLSKGRPLLTSCMMFAPPTYRKFATCVDWALRTSHFTLAGVLLTAVSSVAAPLWWLRDHCVYLSRVLSWLIDVFIIKFSTATPKIFVEIIWSHYYFLIFTS